VSAGPSLQPAPTDKLAEIAAGQGGLFTRTQALGCGFSHYHVRRRLVDGRWVVVLGPVLARGGTTVSPALLDRAVALALPGAVLAGPSAARWYGITVPAPGQYAIVPVSDGRTLSGVRLWREDLPASDVSTVDGVSVTCRSRAVFDCARVLPDADAADLMGRALRERWTTWQEFTTRVHRYGRRRGAPRLAALARMRQPAHGAAPAGG